VLLLAYHDSSESVEPLLELSLSFDPEVKMMETDADLPAFWEDKGSQD
jgi:hypothetical protein